MKRINFIFTTVWAAMYSITSGDVTTKKALANADIPSTLKTKLNAIKTSNLQEGDNISFDIYWNEGKFSGIHNYRVAGDHKQKRYSGELSISNTELAPFV